MADTIRWETPALAFTIPLAAPLALSFTVAPADDVPVQAPQRPADTTPASEAAPEPAASEPSGPPVLPDPPGQPASTAPEAPPPEAPAPAMQPLPPPDFEQAPIFSDDDDGDDDAEGAPAPRLLTPTDKRSFFSLSAGGATQNGVLSYYGGGSSIGFGFEMLIGRYGKRRPNLGGGFVLQYRKGTISEVSLAGRFRARKQLTKAFSLYTVFDTTLGISIPVAIAGYVYPSIPSAQLGVGWGLEAILAERVTVGVRPFAPSLVAPNYFGFPVSLRWDFGVSMGIVW